MLDLQTSRMVEKAWFSAPLAGSLCGPNWPVQLFPVPIPVTPSSLPNRMPVSLDLKPSVLDGSSLVMNTFWLAHWEPGLLSMYNDMKTILLCELQIAHPSDSFQ